LSSQVTIWDNWLCSMGMEVSFNHQESGDSEAVQKPLSYCQDTKKSSHSF